MYFKIQSTLFAMQTLREFGAHTSFLASSPLFILLGYLAIVDAAFLDTETT